MSGRSEEVLVVPLAYWIRVGVRLVASLFVGTYYVLVAAPSHAAWTKSLISVALLVVSTYLASSKQGLNVVLVPLPD